MNIYANLIVSKKQWYADVADSPDFAEISL
jgi:hypothetical protein